MRQVEFRDRDGATAGQRRCVVGEAVEKSVEIEGVRTPRYEACHAELHRREAPGCCRREHLTEAVGVETVEQGDGSLAAGGGRCCARVAASGRRRTERVGGGLRPRDPVGRVRHRGLGDPSDLVIEDEVAAGAGVGEIRTTAVVEADAVGVEERRGVTTRRLDAVPREVKTDVHAVRAGFARRQRIG